MERTKKKLAPYRRKRSFDATPEPVGNVMRQRRHAPIFVVQKHAARSMHYDFRIEVGGVLKSWAIPKGVSAKLGQKHLAIPTEDHPVAYAHFEGVIPKNNYGAGVVMVWDIGTFSNIKTKNGTLVPLATCIKLGRVELFLEGKKLHGGYALIRTTAAHDKEPYWLMVKMDDEYANKRIKNVTKSALTGRTMRQIKDEAV